MRKVNGKSDDGITDINLIVQNAAKSVNKALQELLSLNCVPESMPADVKAELKCLLGEMKCKDDEKIVIALAGKFSSGKSSFINSLIGAEIAPVQIERTTRCKTVFTGNPNDDKNIKIVDATGKSCTLEKYRECSAKPAKGLSSYTVYVPNPKWRLFEIVDTPGFDPVKTEDCDISDDAISRRAVKESDVVFFIVDIGNGTIAGDSMAYLKEIAKLGRQMIFIIVNKADIKSPSARQVIMSSIAEECKRNDIRYDGIRPYSSLQPTSSAILRKAETVRQNILRSIEEMRNDLLSDIVALSSRHRTIQQKKTDARYAVVASKIDDIVVRTRKLVMKARRAIAHEPSDSGAGLRSIVADITDLLTDQASACTSDNASYMMEREEIEDSGFLGFFKDWKVFLGSPGDAYKLSAEERTSLRSDIVSCLESESWCSSKVATKCVALLESVGKSVIASYRGTWEFEEEVGSESDCDEAEEAIIERLNDKFSDEFRKKCREKVRQILKDAKADADVLLAEDHDKKLASLEKLARDLAAFHKELAKWSHLPIDIGEDDDSCVSISSGVVDDNEDEGGVDECKLTRPYECQGEKIVCTETGVVDELCVKEGATVNWCDRLMTIDINAMNRHWPIVSGHAGTVSFRVKRGSRVVKGDVLAIIF